MSFKSKSQRAEQVINNIILNNVEHEFMQMSNWEVIKFLFGNIFHKPKNLGKKIPKQQVNKTDKYSFTSNLVKSVKTGLYFKSAFDYKVKNPIKNK